MQHICSTRRSRAIWHAGRMLLSIGVAVVVAGCGDPLGAPAAAPVPAEHLVHAPPTRTVPFVGRGRGQDVSVTYEGTGIHVVASASGRASGVGRFTEVLDYVLSYDLVNFAGGATITAADGSRLLLVFQGTIPGFVNQVFPLPYDVDYTIAGGTGRLAGSGGSGKLRGIDYGAGAFAFTFAGFRTIPR